MVDKRASAEQVSRAVLLETEVVLSPQTLKSEWRNDVFSNSLHPLSEALQRGLNHQLFVTVALVGFAGDVNPSLAVANELQMLLDDVAATNTAKRVYSLEGGKELPVTTSLHFQTKHVDKTVAVIIQKEIRKRLEGFVEYSFILFFFLKKKKKSFFRCL